MANRRGNLADVVTLMIVALVLFTLLFAAGARQHESSSMMACASNLKNLTVAIQQYLQAHHEWPRTRYEPDVEPTAYTNPLAANPFADDGPALNDITAAYHLLIRDGASPDLFKDPYSPFTTLTSAVDRTRSNFSSERDLSYSFANPYPSASAAKAGYLLSDSLTAEFPIASDMNPGTAMLLALRPTSAASELQKSLSLTHQYRGRMNVAFGDWHVEAVIDPFVGVQRDNLFTFGGHGASAGGLGIIGSPVDAEDTVLLPLSNLAAWKTELAERRRDELLRLAAYWGKIVLGTIAIIAGGAAFL